GDISSAAPACTQADLLVAFADFPPANAAPFHGAFPNDQEVAITIDFSQTNFDANRNITLTAPDLDLTTFTSQNMFLVHTRGSGGQEAMRVEPLTDASYVKSSDGTKGTLTLHHPGHTPWPPGDYTLVVRGGADGVKTKAPAALPVTASQVFYLLVQD